MGIEPTHKCFADISLTTWVHGLLGGDDEIRTRDLSRDRGAFWAI